MNRTTTRNMDKEMTPNSPATTVAIKAPPTRRWRRYSLRTLFALMFVAALPAWWFRTELTDLVEEHEAMVRLRDAGLHVVARPAEPRWFWKRVPEWLAPYRERAESVDSWGGKHVVSDDDVRLIGRLTHLKHLALEQQEAVTDANLAACQGLTALEWLRLGYCPGLTDEGLRHFSGARAMMALNLNGTRVGDACADTISLFPRLESLGLLSTGLTDASMPRILTLRSLRMLTLPAGVTANGLRQISELDQLEFLDVSIHPGEEVAVLSRVCRLPKLERLTVRGEGLTDAGVNIIVAKVGLKELDVYGGAFSAAGFEALGLLARSINVFVALPDRYLQVRHDVPPRRAGPHRRARGADRND